MKMLKQFYLRFGIMAMALIVAAACSDDDPIVPDPKPDGPPDGENPEETGQYLVAAVFDNATYFLTTDDLEDRDAVISASGNVGLEYNNTFSHYVNNGTIGLLCLKYGQGGTHVGAGFTIGDDGRAVQEGTDFEIPSGFTTAGSFGPYVVTARSGQTLEDESTGAVLNFIDMENNNRLVSRSLSSKAFPGMGGRDVNLVGITDAGDGEFFTGLHVVGASTDSVYVAKLDESLNIKKIYSDDRISISGGSYRSARYAQIGTAANGDVYVFSGSSGSLSGESTRPAGALLIKKGEDHFDPSYYFDIQNAADGYRFRRVYHMAEDYFLLEFYNETDAFALMNEATLYGIVRMTTKELKWISGFPDKSEIPDRGTGWPFSHAGKMYIGVESATDQPAVYSIDPSTATAKKGISVKDATSIPGIAFIKK